VTEQAPSSTKMPSDQRKAQIIRAATELFAVAGYVGTSLRDVAQKCGMTKAALYYHYPDKESLLKSVVKYRMTRLNQHMEAALDAADSDEPMDRIRAFVLGCARQIASDRSGWVVGSRIFWSIEAISDRTEMVALRDHFEGLLRVEVERAIDQGILKDEGAGMMTLMILSWLNYLPRWHRLDGPLSAEEVADHFLKMNLNGLYVTREG
jgi:TetR/AcrR family transcriptional regulator, cholesterol catabolism regulator